MTDGARIAYPSERFPALPAVSLEARAGWEPIVFPGALVGVRHAVSTNGFNPNVLVTHERWPGEIGVPDALQRLRGQLAAAAATETRAELDLDDPAGAYLEADQREAALGELRVRYRLAVVPHDGVTDLVTAIGTATAVQAKSMGDDLRAIVRSLSVVAGD